MLVFIFSVIFTDSSSDSASHTHSARQPSTAALLTRSRGGGLTSRKENSKNCVWVVVPLRLTRSSPHFFLLFSFVFL